MLARPNPRAAKTPNAASRSRARVWARRRVTRAGAPVGSSQALRGLADGCSLPCAVQASSHSPFQYIDVSDTLMYRTRCQRTTTSADTKRSRDERDAQHATPPAQAPPAPRQGFLGELWDAVAPGRTFSLVIGVLLIQLAFVLSYVGAFHHPTPHGVPIAVVAPAQISGQLVGELNAIHGHPLHATAVADQTSRPDAPAARLDQRRADRQPHRQDRRSARRRWRRRGDSDRRGGRHRAGRSRPAPQRDGHRRRTRPTR